MQRWLTSQQAVELVAPENAVYAFLREDDAMRSLLTHLPDDAAYAQTLYTAFASSGQQSAIIREHQELVEPLTEREAEILTLVTQSLTYNDIAGELFSSINTVRYHVKGLYGRLGVSSRADAISRAQDLHLL